MVLVELPDSHETKYDYVMASGVLVTVTVLYELHDGVQWDSGAHCQLNYLK